MPVCKMVYVCIIPTIIVVNLKPVRRYLIIVLLGCSSLHAQQNKLLLVHTDAPGLNNWPELRVDSASLASALSRVILTLNEQSYLSAKITRLEVYQDSVSVHIQTGKPYSWVVLRKGNIPDDILTAAGFRTRDFINKKFSPDVYKNAASRMLGYLERNGYPFASLELDSLIIEEEGISASWKLTNNEWTQYDSIEIIGSSQVKKWFLEKYLGFKTGAAYNEQHIKLASARLNQLPFLTASQQARVYFFANKAKPILYADERKASSADGIIGFAPNSQANNNSLLLTGEANLKLQNLFESGKVLEINYRSFLANSQQLRVYALYPYLFKSSVGMDYTLHLIKQDSSFLDVQNQLGLQYRFIGQDYFRVYYAVQSTSLITVDTQRIRSSVTLPDANDLINYQYGAEVKVVHYDYLLNPLKGYSININASIGDKRIQRNPTIDALRFTDEKGSQYSLYDKFANRMLQYKVQTDADVFIKLGNYITSRVQVMAAGIQAPVLFLNDLYRIGGLRTLKGFDEQAIFASTYVIVNTELRYLLQRNAHASLFWNGAYYENTLRTPVLSDTPYGFGAGFNFETAAGVFSIYYALGRQFNNPIEFEKAKVHFGFTSFF